jgi:anti-sigma B factor antagonist
MKEPPMEVSLEDVNGIKLLRVRGELTGHEKDTLVETFTDILGTPKARIVLDISGVSYMNSSGLGELVRMVGQANVQEARVILASPAPYISGILETTRLDRFFDISRSLEEALRRLS